MDAEPQASAGAPLPPASRGRQAPPRLLTVGLGAALVLAVWVAGSPDLSAPWIPGDEFEFIAGNPDVNPGAVAGERAAALPARLGAICGKIHGDLYQPLPLLTYAVEWELSGGRPISFRRTDVLLHALNALLLWWVLCALSRRAAGAESPTPALLAWGLALVWALHPALVTTYASDMGRTHLLSATFALLALRLHVQTLASGRAAWFLGSLAALLLAMLCKVVVGWVLLVLLLEAATRGWRRTLVSPRLYLVAAICAAFAGLTVWTSLESGLVEDASPGLFGDPLSRSALAVWIYFRDLIAPIWLSMWHLPDPATGWTHWRVWAGALLALGSVLHATLAWRRTETRLVAVGWAWFWALLLPVIGLIGAREVAAVDRYLYQPLMGLALVAGVLLSRPLGRSDQDASARRRWLIVPLAGAVGLAMLAWDLPQCGLARGAVRRAERVVRLNPGDPRALEALAVACDFARGHPLSSADLESVPEGVRQSDYFRQRYAEALSHAAAIQDLGHYFPTPAGLGPFHRRLSYRFLRAGLPEQGLTHAQLALEILPDEMLSWKRLAHAYQTLGRFADAAEAYAQCERRLPDDPTTRAVHFTDYGCLLLFELELDAEACPKFAAAFETGRAPLPAKLGMALCQIRHGEGAVGYQLASEVLRAEPTNVRAGLVLAEYHLRSHHWDQALAVYDALIRDDPAHYAALRGFQEACFHGGRMSDAVLAWQDARRIEPRRREFKSCLVWALALAGDPAAPATAHDLLREDPDNPMGCLALMLDALRGGRLDEAVDWVTRAGAGVPVPRARAFERATATVQLLMARGELTSDAVLVQAAVYLRADSSATARTEARNLLDGFLESRPESRWTGLARELYAETARADDPR